MIKGIIESLTIPPMSLALLIVAGLLLAGLRWRRFGATLAWIGVVGLLLLGTPVVSDAMLEALETGLPTTPPADRPPGAIIILGGEVIRTRDDPLGVRAGPLTLERLRTGAALARRTGLPILVTGGVTQPRSTPVGQVMAKTLRDDFGVPARWTEDVSNDTWENALFSAEILHGAGIGSVYVVTSAWHMRRALLAFKGTGLIVTAAPTPLDEPDQNYLVDFIPHAGGWLMSFYVLHEWIGYAWYQLR